VNELLGSARKESENKVKAELKALNDIMRDMDTRIDAIIKQLDEVEEGPEQAVEPGYVAQALAKLEQQWGKELGKLKQELHQTIYAHNHNADLMKHQKDALDNIRQDIETQKTTNDSDRLKKAQSMCQKADTMLKGQQKQKKLEPLFRRLAAIEQRLAACRWPMGMMPGMAHPGMGLPGMAGMPGMPGMMAGMPPGMPAAQLAAAAAVAGGRMPNPAAAAAMAAYGGRAGMMAGQADALAARSAAAAAMAAAAAQGAGVEKESSEEDDEVEIGGRPPGLL